jgi:DNA-binding CsgD family transcriptional regulator
VGLGERDGETARIDRLYAGWRNGRGALVVLNGPVGSGKTALLQWIAERTAHHDGLFFPVTASESEVQHPLGLIDQLVEPMRAAGMADPGLGGADELLSIGPDHVVLQRLCRAVCDFADRRPIVLGIDDVHFADKQSLRCVGYLIRRIEWSRIMIVLTESSSHERELTALHAEILRLAYSHRIVLASLSIAGVTEVLTERIGGSAAGGVAEFCAALSGGNPLLLNALIEDYVAAGSAPAEPAPGAWFRDAVLRCLHRCTPRMVTVARAVAVLGQSATPSLIGELLGTDSMTVRKAVLDLQATGLLTGDGFRHVAARLAVLADIPPKELPNLHRRAAKLLHESGAPARAVADQLLAANELVKASWPVTILREAAREAMTAGNVLDAVRYLRHAIGLCVGAAQRAQVTAALADAQWHLDPATANRYLQDLSSGVHAGLLSGPEALVPVRHLLWRGDLAQADALLRVIDAGRDRDADGGSRLPDEPGAMTISRWWVAFCQTDLTHGLGAEAGRRLGVSAFWKPVAPAAFPHLPAGRAGDTEWAEIADKALHSRPGGGLTPALLALLLMIHLDRTEEATRWSDRLLGEDWVTRVPMRRAVLLTVRSLAALRQGEADAAAGFARTALETVAAPAWGVALGMPVSVLIRAALESADLPTALSHLNTPMPAAILETPFALPYLQAVGRYHLVAGKPRTALTHFQLCGDLARRWQLDAADVADWRNDAAAALTALGQDEKARELAEEQLVRLSDRRFSRERGIALRRLAAASDAPARPAVLREAVRVLQASGDRLELARARSELAAAREALSGRSRRKAPTGRRPAGESGTAPREAEGRPVGRRASDGGHATAVRVAELTEAERRVAALAAAGATNRQIADTLFVTVSTVEQHLTKAYRKLNVRKRSGLPAGLLRDAG